MMRRQQGGYIFLVVMLTVLVVGIVGMLLSQESANIANRAGRSLDEEKASYLAQAGLNQALGQIRQKGCGAYSDVPSTSLGDGSYSATITTNSAGGTLTTYTVPVSDDAFVAQANATTNYGSATELETYSKIFVNQDKRSLYRFDLENAGIPAGANVISATLKLYVLTADTKGTVNIHRINQDWTEASVNWSTINSAIEIGTIWGTISKNAPENAYYSVNMTSTVQAWLNGSLANQGFALISWSYGGSSKYTSKEYSDAAKRPVLEVTVFEGSLSNRADLVSTATLPDGSSRTVRRDEVHLYQPESTTVVQGALPIRDAYVNSANSNANYGASPTMVIQSGGQRNALIRFELAAIPPAARIDSARLEVFLESATTLSGGIFNIHKVIRDWVEGEEDDVTPGTGKGATYVDYNAGSAWAVPGGDYANPALTSITIPDATPGAYQFDVTDQIKAWLAGEPNYGFLIRASGGTVNDVVFSSSDSSVAEQRPRLVLTLACECGVSCAAPSVSGNVLMVVNDPAALDRADTLKKAMMEGWGYTVNLIDDSSNQSQYDTGVGNNDVVYVSESSSSVEVANKLVGSAKGVVIEEGNLFNQFGLASARALGVGRNLSVTDNSHYITGVLNTGSIPIYLADMQGQTTSGSLASGFVTLGEGLGTPALGYIEQGGTLLNGSGAAGRRIIVPTAPNTGVNWKYVNNNARLIVQRALEWGKGDAASATEAVLYWTEGTGKKIKSALGDGSSIDDVIAATGDTPTGVDVDPGAGKVYWASSDLYVRRANLDGTGVETLYTGTFKQVTDVKVDTNHGKMYWSERATKKIMRANLDGSAVETVVTASASPVYLSLDVPIGKVYFTEYGASGAVSRVDFDGQNYMRMVTGLYNPVGQALDLVNSKLYWSDGNAGDKIHRANLNGTGREDTLVISLSSPQDVAVDPVNQRLYWNNTGVNRIQRSDLDGSNKSDVLTADGNPRGLAIAGEALALRGPCSGTIRDEFKAQQFWGSDGRLDWKANWVETGESNGPASGDVFVGTDLSQSYRLRLQNAGRGSEREVDLSGAVGATLSFDYRRVSLDAATDYVAVQISKNGAAGPWTELTQLKGTANDAAYKSYSKDITAYISANTRLRLVTSPSMDTSDQVWFDNVQIQCTP